MSNLLEDFRDVVGPDPGAKYQEKKSIGKGSFATVWQLLEKATGRLVVGKFMDTSKMTEKNRNFALAEANNAAKCSHPNIVEFVEAHERNGRLLLIFEFADAGDLFGQVTARAPSKKHFREAEVWLIMSQLCLALNHLHEKKMMHRDLKTPNVFLTTCGLIKLGDFGFSRQYDSTLSADVGTTFCGTPYYLAPELWNQAPYSKKADIWSLGVILYELMALRKPFSGGTMRELIDRVISGSFDPLPSMYSADLQKLCADMLSVDPKNRPSLHQIFQQEGMRTNGLKALLKNVPRLTTVAESIRNCMIADIEAVLERTSQPEPSEKEEHD
jgi:serine/threonine protein kinase